VNTALSELGYPERPIESYRKLIGHGFRALVEKTLPPDARSPDRVTELTLRARGEYRRSCCETTRPYDGVEEMLNDLKRRNVSLAICSNKPHDLTCQIVDYYFPSQTFEVVFGLRDGIPAKPDPQGVLEACETMRVSPNSALYVGDTETDILTARNAGMTALSVLRGYRDRSELVEAGASALLCSPADILAWC
jgi:phosphoglycolate phosphatase